MPDKVLNIFGSIVTVGAITVVLTNAGGAAQVLNAMGNLFSSSLRTAMGR